MVASEGEDIDINPASELHLYLRLMQLWGLWPYRAASRAVTVAHWIYAKFMMICLLVISIQQLLQMTIQPDLENISAAIDVASLTLAALYRQMLFTFRLDDFKRLVVKVDNNLLPRSLPYRVDFDMKMWLKHSRLLTYIYLFLPILIIIAWVTSRNIDNIKIVKELQKTVSVPAGFENLTAAEQSALNVTFEEREVTRERPNVKRRLPVNCWYPFDSGVSPAFEIAFVWETSMAAVCGMAYVISDAFLFMIIYLICGQLQILKTSLRLLRKDYDHYKLKVKNPESSLELHMREKEVSRKVDEQIIKCIEFHNDIIDLIGDLDIRLRAMIVVDFLHAVVSLSFAMLQTIIANSFYEWIQMLLFIGVCILHQFLNNLFCEVLIQQQVTVAEAAYEVPWVEGSRTLKAAVYITMVQARSPTRLSGWKMYVLGNSTFVDFMKLLSSYFLVLQSLHAEEGKGED